MMNLVTRFDGSKTMKEIKVQNNNYNLEELKNSDSYKKATNLFPDLEITNVKDLKKTEVDYD